ncbi:MAG: T9SS type A sorting domain-containing protein, partial [bacterium]
WPAGGDQYFTNVAPNQNVTITENGSLISIDEKKTELPGSFALSQNFPNPFNPSTVIKYDLTEASSYIILSVYDITGNEVSRLIDQNQRAGNYEIEFKGEGFSSGVYYYKLSVGDLSETKKMMLLK